MGVERARLSIADAELGLVRAMFVERPAATLRALCDEFERSTGRRVCTATMRRALQRAGVSRRQALAAVPGPGAVAGRCATCLTDAEWSLVADLFETPEGVRGRPAKYSRRTMVDACCYVLRTGCAWSALPDAFPPWQAVYKSLSRWAAQGRFEQLLGRLNEYWRHRLAQHPVADH
jgi:putative transposase